MFSSSQIAFVIFTQDCYRYDTSFKTMETSEELLNLFFTIHFLRVLKKGFFKKFSLFYTVCGFCFPSRLRKFIHKGSNFPLYHLLSNLISHFSGFIAIVRSPVSYFWLSNPNCFFCSCRDILINGPLSNVILIIVNPVLMVRH